MFILPGYIIREKLLDSDMIEIYKGTTVGSKMPVLIKKLKEELQVLQIYLDLSMNGR